MAAGIVRFTRRRVRDSAGFGAASLGVLLLVGAVLGTGVARTAVDVSDGLTWLADDPRGEVVQVNPASGRPETRLQVSGGDARLDITQKDGVLVVLDRRDGKITVIDLATLLASGRRQAPPGANSKALVSEGRIYVVDRAAGTIVNADPVTLADVGKPWRAGKPLADVVVDEAAVVWAADRDGTLHELTWDDDAFRERSAERIRGAGQGTVGVPHAKGVTLFGLDGGVVRQVGTGQDVSAETERVSGEVLAALTSPAGLVPAAIPGGGAVVLVVTDEVLRVDTARLGCPEPTRPVVFRDRVYVPCRGSGKVIVLDRSGRKGAPDVPTPGKGDPQLVFDDGRLFISAPGAEQGVVIDADGATKPVTIRDPDLPVVDPDRPPKPDVPSPPRPTSRPEEPRDPRNADNDADNTAARPPDAPGTGTNPGFSGGAPDAPPGVTIMLGSRDATELTATVSWGTPADHGGAITGYRVVATGEFSGGSRSVETTGTSTQLTFPCAGSTFCASGKLNVSVTATNQSGSGPAGTGSWHVPPAQGGPTTTTTQPPQNPPPTTNPPQDPPPTTTTTTEPPPPPPPTLPSAGATVITGSSAPNGNQDNTRLLTLNPPSDWANHNGRCEVVNVTYGYTGTIACSATSVDVSVETGPNRFVVRAHASDGSGSVDSAGKQVRGPQEPMCGQYVCASGDKLIDLSPTDAPVRFGQAGAGVGLLVIATVLFFRRRKDDQNNSNDDTGSDS